MAAERRIRLAIDTGRPHGRALLDGVLRRAEAIGGCRFEHSDILDRARLTRDVRRGLFAGLLCDASEERQRAPLRRLPLPLVCLSGDADPAGLPVVAEDNRAVGRMAAQHLLDLGFRRLAFFHPGTPVSYRHREEGFATAARAAGAGLHVLHDARRLGALPRPIGVFAVTDEKALLVMTACRHLGLRLPDDVAVLGVGNDDLACRLAHPTLTSIDHGLVGIGAAGLDLLLQLIDGRRRIGHRRVPPVGVVPRASTDTVAATDPRVAAALRSSAPAPATTSTPTPSAPRWGWDAAPSTPPAGASWGSAWRARCAASASASPPACSRPPRSAPRRSPSAAASARRRS